MIYSFEGFCQTFRAELFAALFLSKSIIIIHFAIADEAFRGLYDIESALFTFFAGVKSATAAHRLLFIATVEFIGYLAQPKSALKTISHYYIFSFIQYQLNSKSLSKFTFCMISRSK